MTVARRKPTVYGNKIGLNFYGVYPRGVFDVVTGDHGRQYINIGVVIIKPQKRNKNN